MRMRECTASCTASLSIGFWNQPMYRKKYHDFSLVLSRKKTYYVVACADYPRCDHTITIFVKRKF